MVVYKKIKKKDTELEFELQGADHSLCRIIAEELLNDRSVETAFYTKEHPLVGEPQFYLKTKTKDPEELLSVILSRVEKNIKGLKP